MLYVSTRGKTDMVSSAHAISSGLAKDGGLFVPRDFPPVALAEIDAMKGKPYGDRAVQILSRPIGGQPQQVGWAFFVHCLPSCSFPL